MNTAQYKMSVATETTEHGSRATLKAWTADPDEPSLVLSVFKPADQDGLLEHSLELSGFIGDPDLPGGFIATYGEDAERLPLALRLLADAAERLTFDADALAAR